MSVQNSPPLCDVDTQQLTTSDTPSSSSSILVVDLLHSDSPCDSGNAAPPPSVRAATLLFQQLLDRASAPNNSSSSSSIGCCTTTEQRQDHNGEMTIVGLDGEWTTKEQVDPITGRKSRTVSKLALLQLALPSFHRDHHSSAIKDESHGGDPILLLRMTPMLQETEAGRDLWAALKSVLSTSNIIKCGVGIANDVKKLMADWSLETDGWVELQVLQHHVTTTMSAKHDHDADGYPSVTSVVGDRSHAEAANDGCMHDRASLPPAGMLRACRGLRDMAIQWCGVVLPKDMAVAMSDWADMQTPLTEDQVAYAAGDAKASRDVAIAMLERSGTMSQQVKLCLKDVVHVPVTSSGGSGGKRGGGGPNAAPSHQAVAKAAKFFECRKQRYYDNIMTYGPDGKLLFSVDAKKATWYVYKKALGTVQTIRRTTAVTTSPSAGEDGGQLVDVAAEGTATGAGYVVPEGFEIASIQLKFSPDFDRFGDNHILDYFKQPKENRCVVCGLENTVIRCAVVPLMYRKCFPKTYVSHNSYDLLLVCPPCFVKVNFYHDAERDRIAEEFGFPLATNRRPLPASAISSTGAPHLKQRNASAGQNTHNHDGSEGDASGACSTFQFARQCRAEVHQAVKYASALLRNRKATTSAIISSEDDDEPSAAEMAADDGCSQPTTTVSVKKTTNKRASHKETNKRQDDRRAIQNSAWIPEEKITAMEQYVASHASVVLAALGLSSPPSLSPVSDSSVVAPENGEVQPERQPLSLRELRVIAEADVHAVVSHAVAAKFPSMVAAMTSSSPTSSTTTSTTASQMQQSGGGAANLPIDNHAAYVVSKIVAKYPDQADLGVGEFIYRWRCLFLDKLKPQFMPIGWKAEDGIVLPVMTASAQ